MISYAEAVSDAAMTPPQPDNRKSLGSLVDDICSLYPRLGSLIAQFRQNIQQMEGANAPSSITKSGNYWRLVAFVDSLI